MLASKSSQVLFLNQNLWYNIFLNVFLDYYIIPVIKNLNYVSNYFKFINSIPSLAQIIFYIYVLSTKYKDLPFIMF